MYVWQGQKKKMSINSDSKPSEFISMPPRDEYIQKRATLDLEGECNNDDMMLRPC